ncbi:hypothetical protein TgHK011_007729 [Trichoderma gracile]|nr:hypothetical protein TgHK011_007729 [Trichoderma gracile]
MPHCAICLHQVILDDSALHGALQLSMSNDIRASRHQLDADLVPACQVAAGTSHVLSPPLVDCRRSNRT